MNALWCVYQERPCRRCGGERVFRGPAPTRVMGLLAGWAVVLGSCVASACIGPWLVGAVPLLVAAGFGILTPLHAWVAEDPECLTCGRSG